MAGLKYFQVAACEHEWRLFAVHPPRWHCTRCGVNGRDCPTCGGDGSLFTEPDHFEICPNCFARGILTVETLEGKECERTT